MLKKTARKDEEIMEKKNYANLARRIFGPHILNEDRELNQNREFTDTVDRILNGSWGALALEHIAVDMMLEEKDKADFAEYIMGHAGEIADRYTAMALRRLRYPRQSRQLAPYIQFMED